MEGINNNINNLLNNNTNNKIIKIKIILNMLKIKIYMDKYKDKEIIIIND